MKNEGLKEVGKGMIILANLILVLFLINNYMQKDDFSIIGVLLTVYGIISLYYFGYIAINKGDKKC
jgi:hypothetical protein